MATAKIYQQRPGISRMPSQSLQICSLGGKGKGLGKFDNCTAVTTLSNSKVAVVDTNNNRVQILSPRGEALMIVGQNKLKSPWGVAALPFGKFCVSEGHQKRIIVYEDSGEFVSKFKVKEVEEPCCLATCQNTGNILVTDYHSGTISAYDLEGRLLNKFTTVEDLLSTDCPTPENIAVDKKGNILACFGMGYSQIQVFSQNGEFRFKFGNFSSATGIYVTVKDNLIVVEKEERTISLYSTSGEFIQQLVVPATGLVGFPHSVTVVNGATLVVTSSEDLYGCPNWVHYYKIG